MTAGFVFFVICITKEKGGDVNQCDTFCTAQTHVLYKSGSIQWPLGPLTALCSILSGPSDTLVPSDSNEHDSYVNSLGITEMNWCYLLK